MTRILKSTLLFFLGTVFIMSAYYKTQPIEFFEFKLVEDGIFNWNISQIFSRALVLFELALGVLLLLHVKLRKITLPLAFIIMIGFTLFLIIQYITSGNQPDCGCFGAKYQFTTIQGVAKNIIIIFLLVLIWFLDKSFESPIPLWINLILVASVLVLFSMRFVRKLNFNDPTSLKKIGKMIDLSPLYEVSPSHNTCPIDLKKGKYIIAFLSTECGHCRLAATKMEIMKKNNPNLKFYFIIGGYANQIETFTTHANIQKTPYLFFAEDGPFLLMAGGSAFPSIQWVNDGVLEYKTTYMDLHQDKIEKWMFNK